ncbi:hypothetical protein Q5705_09590 [Kosakonia sp. H02]|nr:hypothetical protein Q5705_09590 [Kosakonia sp. H02]
MKLPLYLKILLLVTIGLAVWTQFSTDEPGEVDANSRVTAAKKVPERVTAKPAAANSDTDAVADLFPVYSPPTKNVPVPVTQSVSFPFRAVGLWQSEGAKIVILTDGTRNWLLCNTCRKAGYIRPGGLITPDWRLQAIEANNLIIESTPGRMQNSISLNSLNITTAITK